MKITAIKGFPVWVGFRNQFVVKVETDAGISGLGEGGISGRELAMQGMLEHFAHFLVGMEPRNIEHIWQLLYRSAYFEGGKISGAVISAIDMALWDILGQSLGVPVWQLLGGACRDSVPCFATPGSLTGDECVAQAQEFVASGWRCLRFGIGMPQAKIMPRPAPGSEGDVALLYEPMESIELAVHWIREVRKAVGSGIALSIDFHHRLSVAEAAYFCAQIEDVHLMFLEEPIRAESPAAYKQLRGMTAMPFAVGEEFSSKWAFLPFVEEGLLNFARVDVSNVGGLSEARKIAGWCEAHYIDLMPHNPLGPICTAASVHLGIATNNFSMLEYRHEIEAATPPDLFPTYPLIDGTTFPKPTTPGLGVTFNEEAVTRYPFKPWEAPHLHRRDGQVTNW
ncbi:MAG: mandelate racemase/muconate lactonizing enzyme family protein [Chloroflexi bacterium]|nr:mandelate racemase/muconate lactonizing enzyme family protein [Chloroflexota bacterium]